jgi:dUTP pyrophosphatase
MTTLNVPFTRMPHAIGLPAPAYETEGAAGVDLIAALPDTDPMLIAPRGWAAIPTGLIFEIPHGFQGEVRPRSGLALRHGVTVLNAPGTIDSDYRGEVRVLLINFGPEPFSVTRGMRVAQLIFTQAFRAKLHTVETLNVTTRGEGGFGSTGLHSKLAGE